MKSNDKKPPKDSMKEVQEALLQNTLVCAQAEKSLENLNGKTLKVLTKSK